MTYATAFITSCYPNCLTRQNYFSVNAQCIVLPSFLRLTAMSTGFAVPFTGYYPIVLIPTVRTIKVRRTLVVAFVGSNQHP